MVAPRFPDIEAAFLDWLKATFPELADAGGKVDLHVGSEPPGPSLDTRLPFVVARRMGGPDDFFTDYPVIDIDVFGRSRAQAYDLAEGVRTALLAKPRVGGVTIDTVQTRTFMRRPWENTQIRRWGATYELSARRR